MRVLAGVFLLAAVIMVIRYWAQTAAVRKQAEELGRLTRAPIQGAPETARPLATRPPADLADTQQQTAQPFPAPSPYAAQAAERKDFQALQRRNADIVAWLRYPGIPELDLPVVQRDNSFYMNHDYLQNENVTGSLFLDQHNALQPRDDNLIIYGHNMKNGTMFGKLYRLTHSALLRDYPLFHLDTGIDSQWYIPYAAGMVDDDPWSERYVPIGTAIFQDPSAHRAFTEKLRILSMVKLPTQVNEEDQLLTLVTCQGNSDTQRFILALRAVRPDESIPALLQLFSGM